MQTDTINTLEELDEWVPRFLGINTGGGVFGLQGELGVGKTTFVRSVVGHLASLVCTPSPRVISPTYVLHQLYRIGDATVDHFDLYRLESLTQAGLMEIGYFEALERAEKGGWLFVEWPDRLPAPQNPKQLIRFAFLGTAREITWE